MRSGLICRSAERRRIACGDDNQRRGSFAGISEVQRDLLTISDQTRRRNSSNTLAVSASCERRGSSGLYLDSATRRLSTSHRKLCSRDKFGFNPVIEKLSNGHVRKCMIGFLVLFVIVLLASLFRLLT